MSARQGFSLNRDWLEEHATQLIQACCPSFDQPGMKWVNQFVMKNKESLKACWSHSLDAQCTQCANPIMKEAFFQLAKEVIFGDGSEELIPPELIYGVDETGIQSGVG